MYQLRSGRSPHVEVDIPLEDHVSRLKQRLTSADPDFESVKIHLHELSRCMLSLPPSKRDDEAKRYLPGGLTLQWLWKHNLHLKKKFVDDPEMMDLLALLLVAEKLDHFIEQWIVVEIEPKIVQSLGHGGFHWRSTLWRALVRAELKLGGNSADAAIQRLFTIQGLKEKALKALKAQKANAATGDGQFWQASAHPAEVVLTSLLTSGKHDSRGHFWETKASQYERLERFIAADARHQARNIDWMLSKLALWHPTQPDPNLALDMLRRHHVDIFDVCDISTQQGRFAVLNQARRTAFLLRQRERFADAEWVESLLPSLAPGFTIRKYGGGLYYARHSNKIKAVGGAQPLSQDTRNKPP